MRGRGRVFGLWQGFFTVREQRPTVIEGFNSEGCLLYTSDAADERSSVDLGGRRIIKKKKYEEEEERE